MSKPENPSAFPDCEQLSNGMTLRDWFAGQALTGMLAEQRWDDGAIAAQWAFEYADAMLAERSK